MKQYRFDDVEALQEIISEEFGDWGEQLEITQDMIDRFAELSGDDYWLHTDPEQCAKMSPFKVPIAHGFLTLIILPRLRAPQEWEIVGANNMMNYGSNKLRFTGIVPVGSQVHARSRVKEVTQSPKGLTVVMEQQVNVVGQERPALIYELIFMYI
jgi:acyl dehydratase